MTDNILVPEAEGKMLIVIIHAQVKIRLFMTQSSVIEYLTIY